MVVTGSTVGFHRCLKLRRRFAATFQRSEPVIVSFSIRNLCKGKVKFNWIWTRKVKFVFGCSESENLGSSCFGLSIKNKKSALFRFGSVELWSSDFLWTILSSEFKFHSFSATFLETRERDIFFIFLLFYFYNLENHLFFYDVSNLATSHDTLAVQLST